MAAKMESDPNVAGKVVMITGAGRGIGQAMATAFARQGAKALILAALEEEELRETERLVLGLRPACRVIYRALDVRDEAAVQALVTMAMAALNKHGTGGHRIDVLCANAGVAPPLQLVGESAPAAWWLGLEVNLKGCYLAARYVLPLMLEPGSTGSTGGRIIFTSSIGAGLVEPHTSSYQISKLAVTRLADCIDAEYSHSGIRSFAVHPGRVNTRLLQSIEGGAAGEADTNTNTDTARGMPSRPAQLDDVSSLQNMCIFLISPEADFLSGRWVDATRSIDGLCSNRDVIVEKDLLRAEVSSGWDGTAKTTLPRTLG